MKGLEIIGWPMVTRIISTVASIVTFVATVAEIFEMSTWPIEIVITMVMILFLIFLHFNRATWFVELKCVVICVLFQRDWFSLFLLWSSSTLWDFLLLFFDGDFLLTFILRRISRRVACISDAFGRWLRPPVVLFNSTRWRNVICIQTEYTELSTEKSFTRRQIQWVSSISATEDVETDWKDKLWVKSRRGGPHSVGNNKNLDENFAQWQFYWVAWNKATKKTVIEKELQLSKQEFI